jgi:predicted nuclease of predicted toxin-antitoxin system
MMLFDENLSPKLPRLLADIYPGSVQVRDVGLKSKPDAIIWPFALAHDLAIVSKDRDMDDRARRLGHPPKVIWLRLGNCPTAAVEALIRSRQPDIDIFLADPNSGLLELA